MIIYICIHRGYNEKVVRQQILKARKFTRKDLLNQDFKTKGENKLVYSFTYHPTYSKLKNILSDIYYPMHNIVRFFLKCLL